MGIPDYEVHPGMTREEFARKRHDHVLRLEHFAMLISYKDDYTIQIHDPTDITKEPYAQATFVRRDVVTGNYSLGAGGKAKISQHATDSEIVQTMFGLYKALEEHECREHFHYNEERPFHPHIDVNELCDASKCTDARPPAQN